MLNFAICDDDEIFRESLERYLKANFVGYFNRLDIYTTGTELINSITIQKIIYNIYFLDLSIPDINGIEIGSYIRQAETQNNSIIIYISGFDTVDASIVKIHPYAYLTKPLDYQHFGNILRTAIERMVSFSDYFIFYQNKTMFRVPYYSIIYIENVLRNAVIHCSKDDYRSTYSLSKLSNELTKNNPAFVRIHTSYIINLMYVEQISHSDVKLLNGTVLPVSRKYKDDLLSKIDLIMLKH